MKHDIKFEILYNFLKELKDPLDFVPINSFKKLFNMFYRGIFFIAFLCQKKVEKGSNKIVIVYRCGGSMCGTHTLWERYSMHLIWNIHFYTSESILIVWGTWYVWDHTLWERHSMHLICKIHFHKSESIFIESSLFVLLVQSIKTQWISKGKG